jgi:O-antigen/teichoic acid export membrane protein
LSVKPIGARILLARNVVWNVSGQLAPAAAALLSIPLLARGLGVERLGILAVIWAVFGYFSLLDFGLGRALTHAVSSRLATGDTKGLRSFVWTTWALLAGVGVLAGSVIIAATPRLVGVLFNAPPALAPDVVRSIFLSGLAVPLITTAVGPRAVLEATQRFDLVNLVRVPLGIATYLGPALVLPFNRSVWAGIAVLVVVRAVALVVWTVLALRDVPARDAADRLNVPDLLAFLSVSGWMTLANVAATALVYIDRFAVSALLPVAMTAYYAAPLEIVTKLTVFPAALSAVIFPEFTARVLAQPDRVLSLFARVVQLTFVTLFPISLVVAAFAPEWLGAWLGPSYEAHSAAVVRWSALGVLVNGLSTVPFALLQAAGRSRQVAVVQVLELPVYVVLLAMLIPNYGVNGAAAAWALRATMDSLVLFSLLAREGSPRVPAPGYAALGIGGLALAGFVTISYLPLVSARLVLVLLVGPSVVLLTARALLPDAWSILLTGWRRGE